MAAATRIDSMVMATIRPIDRNSAATAAETAFANRDETCWLDGLVKPSSSARDRVMAGFPRAMRITASLEYPKNHCQDFGAKSRKHDQIKAGDLPVPAILSAFGQISAASARLAAEAPDTPVMATKCGSASTRLSQARTDG